MIDKKPEYKGEGKVWESFSDNLPCEAVVYNGREVSGREFDFCILMKNVGMIIIEVKGWLADSIFDVAGVDEIIIQGYEKPEKSPKKQARAYRFRLLNLINDKYNVSPLIFDLVCYPFITKKEYYDKRLDIVSEESLTVFKEDLADPFRLGDKLLNAFNQCKSIPHAEMDEVLMGKIRQHFEPHFQMKKPLELNIQMPYSVVVVNTKKLGKKQIHDIVNGYLMGTKVIAFVSSKDMADMLLYVLEGELNKKGILAEKNNLKLKKDANNEFAIKNNSFRIFNFELYVVEDLPDISDIDEHCVNVCFSTGEKSFVYPDAFLRFLKMKVESVMEQVAEDIKQKERERQKIQSALEERVESKQNGKIVQRTVEKKSSQKSISRKNIAFKCNYCDGGKTRDRIGFYGVCSDKLIEYNISVAHHVWCSSEECPCRQYYDKRIDKQELNSIMRSNANKGFVCYESAMLRDWKASAGITQTGEDKGKPMRLLKVQPMSLAVLTTREPYTTDDTRFVFAVFLVDETYEGDNRDEGYVTTSSEFRLELKHEEAKKIRFWNYYYNPKAPELIKLGSGLHRYLSAEQAAQILRDIAVVKSNTPEEELAICFYQYFCRINKIDIENLPPPSGALMR